jgi:uncharacterized protein (TIGR00730 family)
MADEVKTTPETKGETGAKAQELTRAIEAGKHEVPAEPSPLVCKPMRVESWRVFKIMSEFVDGFDLIGKYGLAATVFGSERTLEDAPMYAAARDLSGRLAKRGFAVITGGAQGIMEAANRGAYEAGGASVGLNIRLSDKQLMNDYLTDRLFFDHFFVRKVMLAYSSDVYIYFPGGFGTLDEFFEIVTLIQTKKIKRIPIVLYGKTYWEPIVKMFRDHLLAEWHTIGEEDLGLFVIVDTVDEAFEYVTKNVTC